MRAAPFQQQQPSNAILKLHMECSPTCGVLGFPVAYSCPSQSGDLEFTATQLFAQVYLAIPAALVASWGVDSDALARHFSVSEQSTVEIRLPDGRVLLQAQPWSTLAPGSCILERLPEGGLLLALAKAAKGIGSWPYPLQSLAISYAAGDGLQSIFSHDKAAFAINVEQLLGKRLKSTRDFRAAFADAVAEQLSTVPQGPLGQTAFIFPAPGPRCFAFLRACCHLPAVAKLARLARELTGAALWDAEGQHDETRVRPLESLVACLVAGLAGVERHRATNGLDFIKSVNACVGFGGGEYAAAVFAGVLRVQGAMQLVMAHAAALETGAAPRVVANQVRQTLSGLDLRPPRLRLYSSATGAVCDSAAAVAEALPLAVVNINPPARRADVELALMQQGVAELREVVAVSEEDVW